jgi:hypothetical protein
VDAPTGDVVPPADDGAVDAPVDARVDAAVDATVDATVDAAIDAAPPDAACPDPDTDPMCSGSPVLGNVSGDTATPALTATGSTEAWYVVNVVENNGVTLESVTAQIDLVSPPGVNFDLFVTCLACGDARSVSSTNGAGMTDTVQVGRDDVAFTDVGYSILVEIRWVSATVCGDWSLTVTGDVDTTVRPCN